MTKNRLFLPSNSRSLTARRGSWRGIAFAPLLLISACNYYDFDDYVDGGPGHHGGRPSCKYEGAVYKPGESFPASDGCNQCSCTSDGQVACTLRACVQTCGGLTGLSCPDGQYCNYPPGTKCGAADQTGSCETRPDACTREFAPVCGCDDRTYGNACEAAAAGVSVASQGECPTDLACETDADCPTPDCACIDKDEDGVCDNQCPIAVCRDGVCSLENPGSLPEGASCGGFRPAGSPDCARGLFCQYQPGALCGAADAPGVCVTIPDVCPDVFQPVCGCDGQTYGNACEAAANQAGILDEGACPP